MKISIDIEISVEEVIDFFKELFEELETNKAIQARLCGLEEWAKSKVK